MTFLNFNFYLTWCIEIFMHLINQKDKKLLNYIYLIIQTFTESCKCIKIQIEKKGRIRNFERKLKESNLRE